MDQIPDSMAEPLPPPLMSLRQYAKRRGVSAMAVSDAAKDGRLKACIVRDPETGRVKGITDPFLADREWAANTDVSKAPLKEQLKAAERVADPEQPGDVFEIGDITLENAPAADKYWSAKKKELEFRQAASELVEAAHVEAKLVNVFTHCKTRLLAVPSRMKQALPHLTVADVAAVEALLREVLEELAGSPVTS